VGEPPLAFKSDGKLSFRPSTAPGLYDGELKRYFTTADGSANSRSDYGKEKTVPLMFVLRSADTLRVIGWRGNDVVLRRVDEEWKPNKNK
jgi:hypothetical protein